MDQLPAFTLDKKFYPADAWHDKIECSFTPFILGEWEEPAEFLFKLSCPTKFVRKSQEEALPSFGWLFTASFSNRQGHYRQIRKTCLHWGNKLFSRPLFSGRIRLHNSSGTNRIRFALELNPTRLIHHHPSIAEEIEEFWVNTANLSAVEPAGLFDGEFSFDGKDNWIPQTKEYDAVWRRPPDSVIRCVTLVDEALVAEVVRAHGPSLTEIAIEPHRRHSLHTLETYWEFQHRDPTRLVSSLKGQLKKFSRKGFQARTYKRRSECNETYDRNCICITVPLAAGETLAVYAKTNRRIRFEIRQNFEENSEHLGGSHTASTRANFLELFEKARVRCAEQMTDLFSFLRGEISVKPESASTSIFLADLANILRRSENFSDILSLLLNNGKLESVPGLKSELRALSRSKFIERDGPSRNGSYRVCSTYQSALGKLQKAGLASELEARDR